MKKKIFITFIIVVVLAAAVWSITTAEPIQRYPVNSNGQTYGSVEDDEKAGGLPDLIKAGGIDGTKGYIKKSDLPPDPKNPEEALQQKAQMEARGPYTIPLYDIDGKTVIGAFPMNDGTTSENNPALASSMPIH
jgi:hypothetical protein